MKKIFLRDAENNEISPDLVRYFQYQSGGCLIYTFHEIDENKFITLYAVKVIEELGVFVSKYAFNDWEWGNMRTIIQTMLTEIQNHEESSFKDLDVNAIQGMRIVEVRRFKILAELVDSLSNGIEDGLDDTVTQNLEDNVVDTNINHSKCIQLDQLKAQYRLENHINPIYEVFTNYDIPPLAEIPKPKMEKKKIHMKEMYHSPTAKKILDTTITIEKYRQLKQENEFLKQKLVQYEKKYQAILELLNKDE